MINRLADLPFEAIPELPKSGLDAAYDYLAARGITALEEIDRYGIRVLMAHQVGKGADDRAAIVFPHYDMSGNEVDWWSCRLVEVSGQKPTNAWRAMIPSQRGKMYCPAKEPPDVYLPNILDWADMPHGAIVYIHESVIKALNGAKLGYYSIGLNGVWGWCSKKHEIPLIHRLKDLPWQKKQLRCCVVFDSNAATNDQVALSILRFAERMRAICKVEVQHLLLPPSPDGRDWGFDDYVQHHGADAAQKWLDGAVDAPVVQVAELEAELLDLNNEVAVVRNLSKIVNIATGDIMGRGEFTEIAYAPRQVWDETGERPRHISVAKAWLKWPARTEVERLEYMPGEDLLAKGCLNIWRGMAVEPEEGDVSRWLHILDYNIQDEGLRSWVIKWLAYPLVHPGSKLATYLHLYGGAGVGKQALIEPLMRVYGRHNAVVVGRAALVSDFNSIYSNKQLINFDELHGGGHADLGQKINNKMKMLVTGETLVVNRKGDPEYTVQNCAQVVTTSNYVDSIQMDGDDRRACVVKFGAQGGRLPDTFWQDYYAWLDSGGSAAVYAYLLGVDLSGWDPKGWAPMTQDKADVISAGRKGLEGWAHDFVNETADMMMPILRGARVLTMAQIEQCYIAQNEGAKSSTNQRRVLGVRLASAGMEQVEVKWEGSKVRAWVLDKEWATSQADLKLAVRKELDRWKGKL